MRNRIKAIIVVLSMVGTIFGCSQNETVEIPPMEAEESVAISFDVIGGKDVMPLAGYWGPKITDESEDGVTLPETINDETYQLIANCGINLINHSLTNQRSAEEEVNYMMDLGVKYGIGTFVYDSVIHSAYGDNSMTVEEMLPYMSEYMNHPGYAGMYLVDEPGSGKYNMGNINLPNYPELYDKLVRQIGTFSYFNLLPITDMKEKDNYIAYLDEVFKTVNPVYLSYDKYPFEKGNRGKENCYFWNLAIIREYAQEHRIPFWTYMQCGDQWDLTKDTEEYWPDEGQFDWQINTNLAFGVQGLQFYTLLEFPGSALAKTEKYDPYRSGLIGICGNKTQWYYYTEEITKHIRAIDEVLMNSVNKGVIASGEKATWATSLCSDKTMIEGKSWRELSDVEGEALVGCFNYQGKTALYVANYSTEYAQKIKLSFVDEYRVTVIQNAETKYYEADGLTLDMAAGDGVLIVFE